MNKQAYFKLMGLQKIATGHSPDYLQEHEQIDIPFKRSYADLLDDYARMSLRDGELSWLERLWQTIKSWFGSTDAKKALAAHQDRQQGIRLAEKNLADYNAIGQQPTTPYAARVRSMDLARDMNLAVLRRIQARQNAAKFKGKQKQMQDLFVEHGQYNKGLRQEKPKQNIKLTPKEQKEADKIFPQIVQTEVPSYKSQLMGETATV